VIVGEVVWIAVAGGMKPEVCPVGLETDDEAAWGFATCVVSIVGAAWQEVIFILALNHAEVDTAGEIGVVAGKVNNPFSIWAENEGVSMVVATNGKADEVLHFVVLIIAVCIGEAKDAAFALSFSSDVEAAEGTENAVGVAHIHGKSFHFGLAVFASNFMRGDAKHVAMAVGGDKAIFVIQTQGDPGTFRLEVDRVEPLDFKTGEQGDIQRWSRRRRWWCGKIGGDDKLYAGGAAFLGCASIIQPAVGMKLGVPLGEFDAEGGFGVNSNTISHRFAIDFEGSASLVFVEPHFGRYCPDEFRDLEFAFRTSDAGFHPVCPVIGGSVSAVVDFKDKFFRSGDIELDLHFVTGSFLGHNRAGVGLGSSTQSS